MPGRGCQVCFGCFHSKEVLRTCLGLICGYRDQACHSGRVGTRKRREGHAPQHVSSKRVGAGGAQGDKGPRSASGSSRALLPQTLPLQPCPQLEAQAGPTSWVIWPEWPQGAVGSGVARGGKPIFPVSSVARTDGELTADSGGERHPLVSDIRARTPIPLPCPAVSTAAGSPGLGVGVHRGPGPAARPECGCLGWGRAQDQRHGGGRRWGASGT